MRILLFLLLLFGGMVYAQTDNGVREYAMAVHGGAGSTQGVENDPERSAAYYAALDSALSIGNEILASGGKAEDAVIAVICYFEGNPLFNAGKGATISSEGYFELDAAIMLGKDLSAGSVAGVKTVKHPIKAAYSVMTQTPHVMLSGEGADKFAAEKGLEIVDNLYFATPRTMRWVEEFKKTKNGTVGCVALDKEGNLAAGTSTGGMFRKSWGRIGDAPIIGAGTYADNESCAVSCTGHGEYYIRHSVAFNVCARYKYLHETVEQAANYIIHTELTPEAGNGGLIAIDKNGQIAMPYNSGGMFRGFVYKTKGSETITKQKGIGVSLAP
jgi:beta-aspartyl-peptidase (threonine type)